MSNLLHLVDGFIRTVEAMQIKHLKDHFGRFESFLSHQDGSVSIEWYDLSLVLAHAKRELANIHAENQMKLNADIAQLKAHTLGVEPKQPKEEE